ncbi:hypothetical protein [Peribacillus tepidiphilus]|uniref:hypothetical protein n=1 Tax=Peribacillus tepidiphilus TaxID=2652445 RepID=UPI0012911475|nr:hypothetical protein [Peribacillus tepidiphilus]
MSCFRNDNVLGAFDDRDRRRREDFKFDAKVKLDRDDFCRAVRRCLIDDLVAGARDDRRDDRRDHRHRGCFW